ncbi:hypothetical protein [uncultured Empedobacter sp.]|uniref:hypothetical protein n=1 Tax=uncultured Empedobacter sp. TaxID=410844 RepID=UPI002637CFF1|nr:hypothetical protein [uncultured Empedobacter sp.]
MGVITSAAIGAVGVGMSVAKTISENNKRKEYEKGINNYDRQELKNPYDNLQVSRKGTDLALQENARNSANMVEAMQGGGINGLGMLSQIQSNTNDLNQQVAANLDQQYIDNENKKAQGEAMVMQMQELREEGDLAGLGNAMATAQNNSNQALSSAINGAMTTVASVAGMSQNQQMLNNMKGGVTNGLNLNNIAPNNGVEVVRTEIPISSSVTPQGTMATMPQQQGYYPSPNNILNPSIPYDPLRSAGFYNTFQKFRNRGV